MIKNMIKKEPCTIEVIQANIRPVQDALDVLYGRWRLPILMSLAYGNKRFTQISKEVKGISDKVLAKELKELEINQLINRTIHATFPPTVEYSITKHGESLENVMRELKHWGESHRRKIIGK
jgi:DNA-binding HxlR family transcriptional regulator